MDHDRRQAALEATYRSLKDDPRYTEEHKASEMWAAYEKESTHILAAGEKARALLEKEAQGHEMMSVPRPKGENLTAGSPERLIAAQNEATTIRGAGLRLPRGSFHVTHAYPPEARTRS